MPPASIKNFVAGHRVRVRDRMQKSYTYTTTFKAGTAIRKSGIPGVGYPTFRPHYTPAKMLAMGVFEGKYLNDCTGELPAEWYERAASKLRPEGADAAANYFGVKSRMSLQHWQSLGWTPVHKLDRDPRGWFQWYCRYWLGRRIPEVDAIQIARWHAFARHAAQVKKHAAGRVDLRRRQRQALLQWSWKCDG